MVRSNKKTIRGRVRPYKAPDCQAKLLLRSAPESAIGVTYYISDALSQSGLRRSRFILSNHFTRTVDDSGVSTSRTGSRRRALVRPCRYCNGGPRSALISSAPEPRSKTRLSRAFTLKVDAKPLDYYNVTQDSNMKISAKSCLCSTGMTSASLVSSLDSTPRIRHQRMSCFAGVYSSLTGL
jgi:hypothetical protein